MFDVSIEADKTLLYYKGIVSIPQDIKKHKKKDWKIVILDLARWIGSRQTLQTQERKNTNDQGHLRTAGLNKAETRLLFRTTIMNILQKQPWICLKHLEIRVPCSNLHNKSGIYFQCTISSCSHNVIIFIMLTGHMHLLIWFAIFFLNAFVKVTMWIEFVGHSYKTGLPLVNTVGDIGRINGTGPEIFLKLF